MLRNRHAFCEILISGSQFQHNNRTERWSDYDGRKYPDVCFTANSNHQNAALALSAVVSEKRAHLSGDAPRHWRLDSDGSSGGGGGDGDGDGDGDGSGSDGSEGKAIRDVVK